MKKILPEQILCQIVGWEGLNGDSRGANQCLTNDDMVGDFPHPQQRQDLSLNLGKTDL